MGHHCLNVVMNNLQSLMEFVINNRRGNLQSNSNPHDSVLLLAQIHKGLFFNTFVEYRDKGANAWVLFDQGVISQTPEVPAKRSIYH